MTEDIESSSHVVQGAHDTGRRLDEEHWPGIKQEKGRSDRLEMRNRKLYRSERDDGAGLPLAAVVGCGFIGLGWSNSFEVCGAGCHLLRRRGHQVTISRAGKYGTQPRDG